VSVGPRGGAGSFHAAYASALGDYLLHPTEVHLRVAYELGREAVRRQLSVLDLAVAHQEALLAALTEAGSQAEEQPVPPAEVQRVTRAGDFFLESLSSFEMVQRGFKEARQAFLLERRQTELSRQLSTFLADASLALHAPESLEEMLQLVAEQARELVDADCCVVTVAVAGHPRAAEAASHAEDDRRWTAFVRWLDLFAIYRFLRLRGDSVRIDGESLGPLPFFRNAVGECPLKGWLAASLTALDGAELGAIQLFDKQDGRFTADDQSALVHLAQMASAAVERVRLYQQQGD
jgi:Phosphoserine phosphatase RsbU, N-terminal domain/GAF domain